MNKEKENCNASKLNKYCNLCGLPHFPEGIFRSNQIPGCVLSILQCQECWVSWVELSGVWLPNKDEYVFPSALVFNRYLNTDYLAFCSIAFSLFSCLPLPSIYIGPFSGIFVQILIPVDFFWIFIYWTNGMTCLCS